MYKKRKKQPPRGSIQILEAKTKNQKEYIRAIIESHIILCDGPSGSGKSFCACGIAAEHLHKHKIDQIVITRPLVCAGRDIGALPGDIREKIHPFLAPIEENLQFFLGRDSYANYVNENRIRYEPLEVMRGATFHNAYMILDEAQNCTLDQIKMFITRMGQGSKIIINGDIGQTDLKTRSGLNTCMEKLQDVDGIQVVHLDFSDIQRNGIIGAVLMALE